MSVPKWNIPIIVVMYAVSAFATTLHGAYCGFPNVHSPWMLPFQLCDISSKGQQACESSATFDLASGALIFCKWYEPDDSTVFEYKSYCGKAGNKDPWDSDSGMEYCNDNKATYMYDEEQCINTLGVPNAYACIWQDDFCQAMTVGGIASCARHEEEFGCIADSYIDSPNCQWYVHKDPSLIPTMSPSTTSTSVAPSKLPSAFPSSSPSNFPTSTPTDGPSGTPTPKPTIPLFTTRPTLKRTSKGEEESVKMGNTHVLKDPSPIPTTSPSTTSPSLVPSIGYSKLPSCFPSTTRSMSPTTFGPTNFPTLYPTDTPSETPTPEPTFPSPSVGPTTVEPTIYPTVNPTDGPSKTPTPEPTFPLFTAPPSLRRTPQEDERSVKPVNTTAATLATAGVLTGLLVCCLVCWRKCCGRCCHCCSNMTKRKDDQEEYFDEDDETIQDDEDRSGVHDKEGGEWKASELGSV